jgi:hypothetical protein
MLGPCEALNSSNIFEHLIAGGRLGAALVDETWVVVRRRRLPLVLRARL